MEQGLDYEKIVDIIKERIASALGVDKENLSEEYKIFPKTELETIGEIALATRRMIYAPDVANLTIGELAKIIIEEDPIINNK